MKLQRIIHHLKDDRKKYSTYHGEIEKWEESDIEAMRRCRECYGDSAYLADFSRYAVVAAELRERYHNAQIISDVSLVTDDHDTPLRTDLKF